MLYVPIYNDITKDKCYLTTYFIWSDLQVYFNKQLLHPKYTSYFVYLMTITGAQFTVIWLGTYVYP